MDGMLTVSHLRAGYGKAIALREISLSIDEGEVVVLLGPNGAGKSTTLKVVSGLLRPWSGDVTFAGESIAGVRAHQLVRRGIAHVAEGRQLFPGLTVEKNLLLGGYARHDRRRLGPDLDEMYERWPLLGQRRRSPAGSLSGGQQQMLVIAQALMARPRLLLLDEPSLGLAPAIVNEVFEVVGNLRSTGLTVLIVEQLVHRALEVADRGYVLTHGEVVLSGTAAELRSHPAVQQAYLGGLVQLEGSTTGSTAQIDRKQQGEMHE